MADLAELGIRVTSQEAAVADKNLDALADSADRAESSVDKLSAAARRSNGAVSTMNVAVRQQTQVLSATRNALGLTTAEGLNLSRQFADIGVTAASGMSPLMIAIQQGPQLLDIFQQAAVRTGSTVGAVARSVGASLMTALGPFLPLVLGIAAAAGAVAVGWGLATRSLTSDIGKVTEGMGLTEKQLDKLKDKGVSTTATAGDAFKALGTTIKEVFVSVFGDQLDWVSKEWKAFLDFATKVAVEAVKLIGAGFVGTFYTVRDTWKMLPSVIGDAAISAANLAVRAVEWMVNKGIAGINVLIAGAKGLAAVNPAFSAANLVNPLSNVSLQGMNNPFSGSMARAAVVAAGDYAKAYEQTGNAMDRFYARWQANTEATARARISKAAGDPAAEGAGRKPRDEVQTLTNNVDATLKGLDIKPIQVVEPLKLIAEELRLVDSLAQDAARGMADAFGESGRALGDLLTVMSGYQVKQAEIALALKEHRLSEAQAAREAGFAQVQAYGDALSSAKGFFKEGSDGYRTLQAAEQVYRTYQFAMALQSRIMGGQETAFTVGQNLIRATSHGVVAIARALASLPFPLNLAAGVATAAALAAIGVKLFGGGKSGGSSVSSSASDAQAYSAQDASARTTAAQAIASQVNVVVTADRQGLNAYVADTAAGVAAPMAVGAYRGAVSTSRDAIPAEQTQKANMTLRAGRR